MGKPLSGASAAFDLPVSPVEPGETLQAWVYRRIREGILRGLMATGSRLPSSRALSQRLQVSRSTVEVAFDQLRAEGYVIGVVGSGTYVSATLPERFLRPMRSVTVSDRDVPAVSTTARGGRHNVAFIARVADATLFPIADWRTHLLAAARAASALIDDEDDSFGTLALRTQIARYLGAARGIACHASQVIVVTGIRNGLDLCGRVLLSPNDEVLLEDPGFTLAAEIFAPYTRRINYVAVDKDGFQVSRARRHARVKLVHVTAAHQSPTGVTMPVTRRLELLAWARRAGAWIVEDDYDSEFNYRSAPLPALKSLDECDRVIHCGSFNKTMFSGLSIGYMVVPQCLVTRFSAASRAEGRPVGFIEQRALSAFIEDGSLARHIRRTRAVYARRRERVMAGLREALAPTPLRTSGEQSGFHFAWWLPPHLPVSRLIEEASARGLRLENMAGRYRRAPAEPGLIMGDSALSDDHIEDALDRLKEAIAAATSS